MIPIWYTCNQLPPSLTKKGKSTNNSTFNSSDADDESNSGPSKNTERIRRKRKASPSLSNAYDADIEDVVQTSDNTETAVSEWESDFRF